MSKSAVDYSQVTDLSNNTLFTVGHLNVRSINSCFFKFNEFVKVHDFDIIAVTETWINENAPAQLFQINGYNLVSVERPLKRGGGVALYVRDSIHFKILNTSFVQSNNIEHLWIHCTIHNRKICLGVVYNPHSDMYKDLTILDSIFTEFSSRFDYLICTGDININMFMKDNRTVFFNDLILANGLHQLINGCTRPVSKSLIDVILVSDINICADAGIINCSDISDHNCIYCILDLPKSKFSKKTFAYRDYNNINYDDFVKDCDAVNWNCILHLRNINDKIDYLNQNILTLFDVHAPIKLTSCNKQYCPWITPVIKIMQKKRDKALADFKKHRTDVKYNYYKQLRNLTTAAIRREKQAFLEHDINNNVNNPKKMWNNLKRLGVNQSNSESIPDTLCNPQDYGQYLLDKVGSTPVNYNTMEYYLNNRFMEQNNHFFNFKCVESSVVEKIVRNLKSNAVGIDGISRKMILFILPIILDYLTHIINTCLLECVFPDIWKSAIVKTICKRSNPSTYDDLRPISILPILSKVSGVAS